jgi:hypothetical protein
MRWSTLVLTAALCGCGGGAKPAVTPTPSPTEVAATATPTASPEAPWTAVTHGSRTPLRCPASSSRAGWPSRVRALGGGRYVKVWGHRPRVGHVDARGHLLSQTGLGAKGRAEVRALACGRGGRLAVAWDEYRGSSSASLRVVVGGRRARTIEVARAMYEDDYPIQDIGLAFAPDGSLLVVWAVFKEVRAAVVTSGGAIGEPFKLGPASEITRLAAEITPGGEAVVAWATIDAGIERNEHRRFYAVRGRGSTFGVPQIVRTAHYRNDQAFTSGTGTGIRLAVAPNGRALLMWGEDTNEIDQEFQIRVAEAPPGAGFGSSLKLARVGDPADVAIRSDGRALAVWHTADGLLLAAYHGPEKRFHGRETLDANRTGGASASFRGRRARVEWEHGGDVLASVGGE